MEGEDGEETGEETTPRREEENQEGLLRWLKSTNDLFVNPWKLYSQSESELTVYFNQEKEKKKKVQEKFEELTAEREARLEERRKEKEEAAKFGEVPDSEGEESEEEPEIMLKDVVISGK